MNTSMCLRVFVRAASCVTARSLPPQVDSVGASLSAVPAADVPSVEAKKPKRNKFGLKIPSMLKKGKSSKLEVSRRLSFPCPC